MPKISVAISALPALLSQNLQSAVDSAVDMQLITDDDTLSADADVLITSRAAAAPHLHNIRSKVGAKAGGLIVLASDASGLRRFYISLVEEQTIDPGTDDILDSIRRIYRQSSRKPALELVNNGG